MADTNVVVDQGMNRKKMENCVLEMVSSLPTRDIQYTQKKSISMQL